MLRGSGGKTYKKPLFVQPRADEGWGDASWKPTASPERKWNESTEHCSLVAATGENSIELQQGRVSLTWKSFFPRELSGTETGSPGSQPQADRVQEVQTVLSDTAFEFWVVSCKARSCVSLPTQDALWFCKWEKADISLNMWGCFMNFSNLSNIQLRHSSRKKRSVYHELWRLNYLHTSSWGNE